MFFYSNVYFPDDCETDMSFVVFEMKGKVGVRK